MKKVRVRFAPSPTGPLHIGGVRTALYNFLFAKKNNGDFILRIEDTDRTRYVEGAESYIQDSLKWCGLSLDEGPGIGGGFGPYKQSERKDLYHLHVKYLLDAGHAYYAFDTPEALSNKRQEAESNGVSFKYSASSRMSMKNSLTVSSDQVADLIESGKYVVRLKINPGEKIIFSDIVRGEVSFMSDELDDKVILKDDGLPTYHWANIVDDHTMEISHVIRGEEWLSSTAHHVIMYRMMGWGVPQFAHLPLILKPTGKGKLSKRDGTKFGFPVFPIEWRADDEPFDGFRESGFLPSALINFLAFLGWNPGTEKEIFSLEELIEAFSMDNIVKSGARFDFDKAKWFNQEHIKMRSSESLLPLVQSLYAGQNVDVPDSKVFSIINLMKERVDIIPDFYNKCTFFFLPPQEFDEKMVRKKYKPDQHELYGSISNLLRRIDEFDYNTIKSEVSSFIDSSDYGFGDVLPVLRLSVCGTMSGPDIFKTMELIGKDESLNRLEKGLNAFNIIINK